MTWEELVDEVNMEMVSENDAEMLGYEVMTARPGKYPRGFTHAAVAAVRLDHTHRTIILEIE